MRMKVGPVRSECVPLLMCFLVTLPACQSGKPRKPTYPAEGKVLFEGRPTPRATVWLHPVDKADPKAPRPFGVVQKDGTFQLSTYERNDGAPAGQYRASVFWRKLEAHGDSEGDSLLPGRYQNPETAELPIIDIKEGPNVIPPLQLQR
jgi:hypothetical protein